MNWKTPLTALGSKLLKLHPRVISYGDFAFHPHRPTELCKIMTLYGSDKGAWHNYTTLYHRIFSPFRDRPLRLFELGLGSNHTDTSSNMGESGSPGASLRGWREYFPQAAVFGADIDARILFTEDRIKTFQCDQTNPQSIHNLWTNPELEEDFDVIIEDGLHEFSANQCFFDHSIHKLRPKGYFVIEDLDPDAAGKYTRQVEVWRQKHPRLEIDLFKIPSLIDVSNWLLLAHRS